MNKNRSAVLDSFARWFAATNGIHLEFAWLTAKHFGCLYLDGKPYLELKREWWKSLSHHERLSMISLLLPEFINALEQDS